MLNLDAVLLDAGYWQKPEVFLPERHLNEDGTKVIKSDHFYPFGLGINQYINLIFCWLERLVLKHKNELQENECVWETRWQKIPISSSRLHWLNNFDLSLHQMSLFLV